MYNIFFFLHANCFIWFYITNKYCITFWDGQYQHKQQMFLSDNNLSVIKVLGTCPNDGEAQIWLAWLEYRNPLVDCGGNTFYSLPGTKSASIYPRLCNLIFTSVMFERLFYKASLLDKKNWHHLIWLFAHTAHERKNVHICGIHFRPCHWNMCLMQSGWLHLTAPAHVRYTHKEWRRMHEHKQGGRLYIPTYIHCKWLPNNTHN